MATKVRIGRPFSSKPKNTDEQWEIISTGMKEIFNHNSSKLSFEELYRSAYTMVLHKDGEKLYQNVAKLITEHLSQVIQLKIVPRFPPGHNDISITEGQAFLQAIRGTWDEHMTAIGMFSDLLKYMDRSYLSYKGLPLTYDMCLNVYRDTVILSKEFSLKNKIIDSLLRLIHYDREGHVVDKMLLSKIVKIFMVLSAPGVQSKLTSLYDTDLEGAFLAGSTLFYRNESQRLSDCSAIEFFSMVKARLDEESTRVSVVLSPTTEKKVLDIVDFELITNNMDSGLISMIKNERIDALMTMYDIFKRVPTGHPEMRQALAAYIKELGRQIPSPESAEKSSKSNSTIKWVEAMLQLNMKFENLLTTCFNNDTLFEADINSAMQTVVNGCQESPEYVSLYMDHILRQQNKGKLDEDFNIVADKSIAIFRFLQEKDRFERYYKQHLAKRMLQVKINNEDSEKILLSKLKLECGYQFTSKLEGMFTDSRLSLDLSSAFKQQVLQKGISAPELSVSVLTSTYWPFSLSDNTSVVPAELESIVHSFENFYLSKHSGRRLQWLKNMGTADLKISFGSTTKEVNMSTHCMFILLNYFKEGNDPVPFSVIAEGSGIPPKELVRTLQTLSLAQDDTFQFNTQFTSPLSKIKILTISSAENATDKQERQQTLDKVNEDRKHQIEASIVRIMKSRKTLEHNVLVSQVIGQLASRFTPVPSMVKQRIESLIEREYLERDAQQKSIVIPQLQRPNNQQYQMGMEKDQRALQFTQLDQGWGNDSAFTYNQNPNWTREETDELMQLVKEYNHRFHIVKDRFSMEKSMVDIKQRYFQINRTLLNHREKKKGFIFDASREAKRIENIERLINRTQEELDNEELLYSQIKQRSNSSYDDRLYKIMSFNLEATNSIGEKSANLKKKKVRKEGVYLASRPLLKQQKIAAVLEEYGYKPIRMPSVNVMEHYETLHSNICILLDLKKSIDKMQLEIRNSDGLKKRTHTNVYHTPRDKKQRIN
ncbi:hypothetical protein HK103_004875 [Boothiomyces macroporosus]|uniref:Cullin family profile domain-containing protein n=1 Tax=Boothiomyces macroporosus TaxID=261099 RepID=A0AAD5Y365_9FUNG|nr:hypothetical protein HK103_004875 [Boothiomyces macroporosus]